MSTIWQLQIAKGLFVKSPILEKGNIKVVDLLVNDESFLILS